MYNTKGRSIMAKAVKRPVIVESDSDGSDLDVQDQLETRIWGFLGFVGTLGTRERAFALLSLNMVDTMILLKPLA